MPVALDADAAAIYKTFQDAGRPPMKRCPNRKRASITVPPASS